MKVAVLISVCDRRDEALECLSGVYRQIDSLAGEGRYAVDVWLNDDASSDGLSEAVALQFPQVRVVASPQRLYANRGLRLAWETASAAEDYDFYLWLDSGIRLREGTFYSLLENSGFLRHEAIVCGTVEAADGRLLFGGRARSGRIINPDSTIPVPCRTFDGALVLVPRHAFRVLGPVDQEFQQELGAWDYGIRAAKAGINRVVAPGIPAVSESTPGIPAWKDSSLSLKERFRALGSPGGRPFGQQFTYDLRSRGLLWALWGFLKLNLQTVFAKRK